MDALPANRTWPPPYSHGTYQHKAITSRSRQLLMMGTWLPETCWVTIRREKKNTKSDIYLVFLIHTELRCTVNHTSDLSLCKWEVLMENIPFFKPNWPEKVESSWNLMAHGDAGEGEVKWKLADGVGSQYSSSLHRKMVYPALLPLMRTPRLPVVHWMTHPPI